MRRYARMRGLVVAVVAATTAGVGCATLPRPSGAMADVAPAAREAAYEAALATFITRVEGDRVYVAVEGRSAPGAVLRSLRVKTGKRLLPYWRARRRQDQCIGAYFTPESRPERPIVSVETLTLPGIPRLSGFQCTYALEPGASGPAVVNEACSIEN